MRSVGQALGRVHGREGESEQKAGTDSSQPAALSNLGIDRERDRHGVEYTPSGIEMSRSLIGGLDIAHSDYSFIDLGAGKGRVLLIASHFRFRRVVGIELSEKLAQIARANVAVYRSAEQRCRNIDVVAGDAGAIDFPAGPMVIYLYNAFDAVVLGQVSP